MGFLVLIMILIIVISILAGKSSKVYVNNRTNIYLGIIFLVILLLYLFKDNSLFPDLPEYFALLKNSEYVKWNEISKLSSYSYGDKFEIGWCILTKFIASISVSNSLLVLVVSSIILYAYLKTFKEYSICIWFAILLFLLVRFYNSCFVLRQNLAVALCILSIPYIEKKKLFPFLLMILLACSIHQTAIIFIILYPLYRIPFNWKYIVGFCVAIYVITFLFHILTPYLGMFMHGYDSYLDMNNTTNSSNATSLYISISVLLFVYLIYKNSSRTINEFDQLTLHALLIIVGISFMKIGLSGTIGRLSDYFGIFSLLGITNACAKLKETKIVRPITIMVIIVFYAYLAKQKLTYGFTLTI